MKLIVLLSIVLYSTLFSQLTQTESYDYVFIKKGNICAYNILTNKTINLTAGYDPCISPDGKNIAYTSYGKDYNRRITVMDIINKTKFILNINNSNYYGPVWSPDNKFILFNIYNNSRWDIGIISKENNDFKILTDKLPVKDGVYLTTWGPDNKTIITHDLENIFIVDLDGNLLEKYSLSEISGGHASSSDCRFFITRDKKYFIFDGDSDDEGYKNVGPPSAIYKYDFASKKIKRLSPKGFDCRHPFLVNNSLFYESTKFKSKKTSIFKMDFTGALPVEILKNATYFSSKTE